MLRIERSQFVNQHLGHHVKSRARRTELLNNDIMDGAEGNSSYLVDIPDGGDLVIIGNIFQKGPRTQNRNVAIAIGLERGMSNPTSEMRIENNKFTNDLGSQTIFVRNRTPIRAALWGNTFEGKVRVLDEIGAAEP